MIIRSLQPPDAEAYVALRREALLDSPLAFAASPEDDLAGSVESFLSQLKQVPDAVIFGAFSPELAGITGLYRDRHVKARHKMHLWGMYVTPTHRGRGTATELLQAGIEHAGSLSGIDWVQLSVTSAAPGARRLYERAGFQLWGTEPDSLRQAGGSVIEHHLVLRLD